MLATLGSTDAVFPLAVLERVSRSAYGCIAAPEVDWIVDSACGRRGAQADAFAETYRRAWTMVRERRYASLLGVFDALSALAGNEPRRAALFHLAGCAYENVAYYNEAHAYYSAAMACGDPARDAAPWLARQSAGWLALRLGRTETVRTLAAGRPDAAQAANTEAAWTADWLRVALQIAATETGSLVLDTRRQSAYRHEIDHLAVACASDALSPAFRAHAALVLIELLRLGHQYERAMATMHGIHDSLAPALVPTALLQTARICSEVDSCEAALPYWYRAVELLRAKRDDEGMSLAFEQLADCLEAGGRPADARHFLAAHVELEAQLAAQRTVLAYEHLPPGSSLTRRLRHDGCEEPAWADCFIDKHRHFAPAETERKARTLASDHGA